MQTKHLSSVLLLCAPIFIAAQSEGLTGISRASAALGKSLPAEQGDDAHQASRKLFRAIDQEIQTHPPATLPPEEIAKNAKPAYPAMHLAELLPLLANVDAAVLEHNLILARDYSRALDTAIRESLGAAEERAYTRYLGLPKFASTAFDGGDFSAAEAYSTELLAANQKYAKIYPTGEGVFYGNLVKGQLAMVNGNTESAASYLLAAAQSSGSPHLDTFGPNMSLARDLLLKGQSGPVLAYLDLCATFWKMERGALTKWKSEIQAGKIPDFGPNLKY